MAADTSDAAQEFAAADERLLGSVGSMAVFPALPSYRILRTDNGQEKKVVPLRSDLSHAYEVS
jgi:hypothetical protein